MNLFSKKSYFSLDGNDDKKKSDRRKRRNEPSIPDGMWIKKKLQNINYAQAAGHISE